MPIVLRHKVPHHIAAVLAAPSLYSPEGWPFAYGHHALGHVHGQAQNFQSGLFIHLQSLLGGVALPSVGTAWAGDSVSCRAPARFSAGRAA
ncbi:hypothetical protein [Roseospira visakhapatnamensis]|uniref:Uncharacterized protein n=1 Tax=Roseospira visakhapatnamensis TaxID=390880 RepID=A0A7W6WBR2_9PROT|nr:hypothetical protein [Roseospira visakhapatnamensis]MBB4267801.1 hypothetical protein [Roseospira visakhapatnamensis]